MPKGEGAKGRSEPSRELSTDLRLKIADSSLQGEPTEKRDPFLDRFVRVVTEPKGMTRQERADEGVDLVKIAVERQMELLKQAKEIPLRIEDAKAGGMRKIATERMEARRLAEQKSLENQAQDYQRRAQRLRDLLVAYQDEVGLSNLRALGIADDKKTDKLREQALELEVEQGVLTDYLESIMDSYRKIPKESAKAREDAARMEEITQRAQKLAGRHDEVLAKLEKERARTWGEAKLRTEKTEKLPRKAPSRKSTMKLKRSKAEPDTIVDEAPRTITESKEPTMEMKRPNTEVDTQRAGAPVGMTLEAEKPDTVEDVLKTPHTAISIQEERRRGAKGKPKGVGAWLKGLFKRT